MSSLGTVVGGGEDRLYDLEVINGFARYLFWGLPPGSFESACIEGNYAAAFNHAHPSLKQQGTRIWGSPVQQDIVANMIEFTSRHLPEFARGDYQVQMAWCRGGGLSKRSDYRTLFRLSQEDNWIDACFLRMKVKVDWLTGDYLNID